MNDNRHPAGTSLGGQWAPGSAAEISLDDALDETPTGWDLFEPEAEPEYPIADDGGFDFDIEGASPREERFLHVREPRHLDLRPGDVAVVESLSGRDSFVMAGSRGICVLEPSDEGCYELLSLVPRSDSQSGVNLGTDGVKSVPYDEWFVEGEEQVTAGDVDEHSRFPRDGAAAKKIMLERARTDVVGSLTSSGERQWCQSRQAGPEFATHPLAREKAYDLVSARPDLSIRPSLSDDEEFREWDEFSGLDSQQAQQVFASRVISGNSEEHYFADGDSIFVHRSPDNETERIA